MVGLVGLTHIKNIKHGHFTIKIDPYHEISPKFIIDSSMTNGDFNGLH
jgi:hypothetical protein